MTPLPNGLGTIKNFKFSACQTNWFAVAVYSFSICIRFWNQHGLLKRVVEFHFGNPQSKQTERFFNYRWQSGQKRKRKALKSTVLDSLQRAYHPQKEPMLVTSLIYLLLDSNFSILILHSYDFENVYHNDSSCCLIIIFLLHILDHLILCMGMFLFFVNGLEWLNSSCYTDIFIPDQNWF